MIKKVSAIVLVFLLLCCMACPAFAAASKNSSANYVFDYVNAYTDDEYAALDKQAKSLSEDYQIGVYLAFVSTVSDSGSREYAKQFYNQDPMLGMGDDNSGILFLVATESREYVTVTYGRAIDAFSDSAIASIEANAVSYLKNDDLKGAGTSYYADAEAILATGPTERGTVLDAEAASSGSAAVEAGGSGQVSSINWLLILVIAVIVVVACILILLIIFRKRAAAPAEKNEPEKIVAVEAAEREEQS